MTNLDLLILEDSDHDFENIHKANFDIFNKANKNINFAYQENRATDIKQALDLLNSDKNFYAAIIDLKITNERADDAKGNILIERIYKKFRIPIFVYSNNLPLLDESFSGDQSFLLRAYIKAQKPFIDILNEIEGFFNLGIIDILGKRGILDNFLNKIFWEHFSAKIDHWSSIEKSKEEKEKILIRYISEHLKEHLELKEGNDLFDHYVPEEVYIFPKIKPFLFTGSILKNVEDEFFYLVLNPSCDFAQQKAHYVLISKIDPQNSLLQSAIKRNKKFQDLDDKDPQKIEALICINKLLCNGLSPRYHYLPGINSFEGGLIDFQKLTTLKQREINGKYEIVGTVTSSFMKDITARFSYYYSRQGSPDFEWADIIKKLLN